MQFIALPIGIALFVLFGFAWQSLGPAVSLRVGKSQELLVATLILLSFPLLIFVHEILHALVHPSFGGTPASVIGVWPKAFVFFAHYSAPLTRDRFLAVFVMPFLVISVLPLGLAFAGLLPAKLMFAAAWFSTWNALFACGDCFGFFLILYQVPRAAILRNKGWRTYWKAN